MEKRPNPDLLLARVQADQGRQACGRLKIFFGASAGVGKTYAMLEAAHEQRNAGVDVLAGYSDQIWVMLVVALVISTLTTRIKRQADAARDRERRTSALYALSRDFASTRDIENILRKAVKHINDVFDSQAVITLPNAGGRLQARGRFAGWWPSYDGKRTIFAPDTGADDYLTKPFSVGELLARMRVALRHAARGGRRSTTRFKRLASCVWIWRGGMC